MKARFQMQGLEKAVLVVEPDHGLEAILAALYIRYDSNTFNLSVERYEDGQIKTLTFSASEQS